MERINACIVTNDTSAESPWSHLKFNTLKVLASLKLTSKEVIEVKKSKTRHAAVKFNKICFSRREGVAASWSCHAHFQDAKLKLKSRAFRWCIVCFCTSNDSFWILILRNVSFGLLHPVHKFEGNVTSAKRVDFLKTLYPSHNIGTLLQINVCFSSLCMWRSSKIPDFWELFCKPFN